MTELVEACYRRTGIRVKQGYGMTETVTSVFNQTWDEWDSPIGSSDPAEITSTSMDSEPDPLPQGAVGEIYVRGPTSSPATNNNPLATAE
ncbi:hypothetical protein LTR11_011219 [Exophiala xenobiotica]|nr:hypothetical protein LTR11_011219 [Exophiala xenobiotica]